MARTFSQIYGALIEAKESQLPLQELAPLNDSQQQLLSDLNSTSKVAVWRLLLYIVASAIYFHENLWDLFRIEIADKIANGTVGTARWYQQIVLQFQYGYSLIWDNTKLKYQYAQIDDAAKIVKHCAVVEGANGILFIKVAKGSNTLEKLSNPEIASLTQYVKSVRFAGTWYQVISGDGDILRVAINIQYDAIVDFNSFAQNVYKSIRDHVQNLPFNGVFRIINLIDSIQKVEGVVDVIVDSNSFQTKGQPLANYINIAYAHTPNFGYYRIDDTPGNRLEDTIMFYPV